VVDPARKKKTNKNFFKLQYGNLKQKSIVGFAVANEV